MTEPSRPRKVNGSKSDDLLEEAAALKDVLRDANTRTHRLVAGLQRHKKQNRAWQARWHRSVTSNKSQIADPSRQTTSTRTAWCTSSVRRVVLVHTRGESPHGRTTPARSRTASAWRRPDSASKQGSRRFSSSAGSSATSAKLRHADTLTFDISLSGVSASGEILVRDHLVEYRVQVPWTLTLFTGRIKHIIEESGRRLLGIERILRERNKT